MIDASASLTAKVRRRIGMVPFKYIQAFPSIPFEDLAGAIAIYTKLFGFEERFVNMGGGDAPVFAVLSGGDVTVYMDAVSNAVTNSRKNRVAGVSAVTFSVQGIEEIYERCVAHQLTFDIVDLDSGKYDLKTFTVRDLEGNQVTFNEPSA
jgi:uncharacterized glyoxalase superfamily protein PhnB